MEMDREAIARFFRGVYLTAATALGVLTAACWLAWGWRAGAGMAAGGVISIGVLLSWQWLAAWVVAAPGSRAKRRLLIAWPLKYAAIGIALYALLRWEMVNVFALIAGLGLTQAILFGRALTGGRVWLTPPLKGEK